MKDKGNKPILPQHNMGTLPTSGFLYSIYSKMQIRLTKMNLMRILLETRKTNLILEISIH